MQIGIIGSGVVGQTLSAGLGALGHEVMIGTRSPGSDRIRELLDQDEHGLKAGDFAQTAAFGELVFIATTWSGTENAIQLANPTNFTGKTVIDATNPLVSEGEDLLLADTGTISAAELIQQWLPGAFVVKAFNMVPAPLMIDPDQLGERPDMFIAGDNAEAKATAVSLLEAFNWPVIDLGALHYARQLESLALIWIRYMQLTNNWHHAFKLIRKQ